MDRKTFLLEGMKVWDAYQKAKPYLMFGNFIESLKREDNAALIESIQAGVMAVLEGKIYNSIDPDGSLMKHSQQIMSDPKKALAAASGKDKQGLQLIIYPMLANKAEDLAKGLSSNKVKKKAESEINEGDITSGEMIFTKLLNAAFDKLDQLDASYLEKALAENPSEKTISNFFWNFVDNFVVPEVRTSLRRKLEKNFVPNEGNVQGKYAMYTKEYKREHGEKNKSGNYDVAPEKQFGTVVQDNGETLTIKWKGVKKPHTNKFIIAPFTEEVPRADVDVYDMVDPSKFGDSSRLDLDQGDGDAHEKTVDTNASVPGEEDETPTAERGGKVVNAVYDIIKSLGLKEPVEKALEAYVQGTMSYDKAAYEQANTKLKNLRRDVANGRIDPEEGKQRIAEAEKEFEATKNKTGLIGLANQFGVSRDDVNNALRKLYKAVSESDYLKAENERSKELIAKGGNPFEA